MNQIPKTLRLSFFSIFLALDFIIGFIPFGGLIIGWLMLPMVIVLCGWRYGFLFYAYDWISALPSFLGSTATTISEANVIHQQNKALILPFIPYLTPAINSIQSTVGPYVGWFQFQLAQLLLSLPLSLRSALFAVILMAMMAFLSKTYLKQARQTLSYVPQLISYGIISPDDKIKRCPEAKCDFTAWSDWRMKRHMKRKHR